MIIISMQYFGNNGASSGKSGGGAAGGRNTVQGVSGYDIGSTVSNGDITLTKVMGSENSGRWESDKQVYDAVMLNSKGEAAGSKTPKYHVIEDNGSFTVYEHSIYRTRRVKKVDSLEKAMKLMS